MSSFGGINVKGNEQVLLVVYALWRSYVNRIKGRARHIPTQTDTVVRFASEHVVLFLCLLYLGNKETPQGLYP